MAESSSIRFSLKLGDTDLLDAGLQDQVQTVTVTLTNERLGAGSQRGKRRPRLSSCELVLDNSTRKLDNILRLGQKLTVRAGYDRMYRLGTFLVERPRWHYPASGVPSVRIKAVSQSISVVYEKRAMTFPRHTHSQVAETLAKQFGFKAKVTPTREPVHLQKGADETVEDFLERLAMDIGYECWFDDSEDPAVLHFEPVEDDEDEPLVLGAGSNATELTIGLGDDPGIALRAAELTIERYMPRTFASTGYRDQAGKVRAGNTANVGGVNVGIRNETIFPTRGSTPDSLTGQKLLGISRAASPRRVVDATLIACAPMLRLNRRVRLRGHGDHDRRYRLVKLVHRFQRGGNAYTTLRGLIGGVARSGGASSGRNQPRARVGGVEVTLR